MNVISLTGNLCKDINVTYTKNNKMVVQNTLAVVKDKKNEDGTNMSDFIEFVVFEKKAEYLNSYAKKGDKLEIVGKLRVDSWQDSEGNWKDRTYVVADKIKILTSRPKTEKVNNADSELPF